MKTNSGLIFDENDLSSPHIDDAGFHNSIYRSKDITSYLTDGSLWTRISSGKFTDLFIGDYFNVMTVDGVNRIMKIAAFDWFYKQYGSLKLTKHHAVIIPNGSFSIAPMNATSTTVGGYIGSKMFKSTLPYWAGELETALGAAHVLQTSEYLTSSINANAKNVMRPNLTGASNDCNFENSKANLLSETEVYGYLSYGSSGYECEMGNSAQLPLFRLNPSNLLIYDGSYWLRTIASSEDFCTVTSNGTANCTGARFNLGIRPRFVIG